MKSLLLVALLLTIVVSEHLERPNEATGGPGCPEGHRGLDDHGHHGEHGNHGGQQDNGSHGGFGIPEDCIKMHCDAQQNTCKESDECSNRTCDPQSAPEEQIAKVKECVSSNGWAATFVDCFFTKCPTREEQQSLNSEAYLNIL